jgi:hypothetical protein
MGRTLFKPNPRSRQSGKTLTSILTSVWTMAIAMSLQIFTTTRAIRSNSIVSWKPAKIPRTCGPKMLAGLQDGVLISNAMTADHIVAHVHFSQ